MKKNYFITIVACLFVLSLTAQPVITYNGNAPVIGDHYHISGVMGSFDPGSPGGNQNWDFSDVTPTMSWDVTAVNPETTPFSNDFPEANIAFFLDSSPGSYNFAQISSSEFLNDGNGIDQGEDQEILHYTDAVKLMQYPFSYNNSFSDSYFTIFPFQDLMIVHESGTITVTADAWGSLITPEATFNSTLRIKQERVYTDSVWTIDGEFVMATTHSATDYQWYTATSHHCVVSMSVTESGSTLTFTTEMVGVNEYPEFSKLNVYPNPVNNIINIKSEENITEVCVISLTGQQVLKFESLDKNQFSADISVLVPGVYFLKVKNNSGVFTTSKFIKQ